MRLSIAPKYSADQLVGVREILDGMIMRWVADWVGRPSVIIFAQRVADGGRYVPQVQGVLLAHWDHTFPDDTVQIINECPYGVLDVEVETIVWSPKVGQKMCESGV